MTRKLHPSARTNAALRREIQESSETNKALAARLGLNLKTIAKWRSRPTTSDARKGPRPVSTVLSATEEALIVVFRKHTRFTLDVCMGFLKPRIPALTRSALHVFPDGKSNLRSELASGLDTFLQLAIDRARIGVDRPLHTEQA
jgi:hypothetical protein